MLVARSVSGLGKGSQGCNLGTRIFHLTNKTFVAMAIPLALSDHLSLPCFKEAGFF